MQYLWRNRNFGLLLLFTLLVVSVLNSCGGVASSSSPPVTNKYLYVGVASDQGGVQGFRVDPQTGTLAEVAGSPLLFGASTSDTFSQAGPLAAAQGHVYVGFGPPNLQLPVIRSFAVNPATGSLGTFTETDAGAVGGDQQIRALVTDSAGRNLYAVYQNSIASFQINPDGSLVSLGSLTNLATAFIFSLTIDPASNLAFVGVDNCPPKGNLCTGPPDILLLNRDAATGALSNTHKLANQNSVWSPGALAMAPSGNFLVAWTVAADGTPQFTVFRVDPASGMLTAAGAPASTGLSPVAFAFDASGNFLYVLNSSDVSPQPENVTVFGFSQQTGAVTQLQTQLLPAGTIPSALLVNDSFAFVVNSQAGSMPSVIHVLPRDANSGLLSAPAFSQPDTPGGEQVGLGQAAELRF